MNEALAAARKIYIDSNCIIYFVERDDELQARMAGVFANAASAGQGLACSEIGLAECLHGAFRLGSSALEAIYVEMFRQIALFEFCPVDGGRTVEAARLGAEKSLKLVDAIHFLAAIELGCDVFVTNDDRFRSSHGVRVVQLKDL